MTSITASSRQDGRGRFWWRAFRLWRLATGVAERDLIDYVASRPGDLVTASDAAAALDVSPAEADLMLGALAAGLGGEVLTRRQGGWVYQPRAEDEEDLHAG